LSSSDFKAVSCRDGQVATLILKDGVKVSLTVRAATEVDKQGTYVEYTPAQSVYNVEPIHINFEEVKKMCRDWSYLCKGLEFNLANAQTGEKVRYLSNNGLLDFMKDNAGRAINKTPLSIQVQEGDIHAEIVMEWTDSRAERSYVYTNGLENPEGGSSLTGAKTAITNFFKKRLKGEVSPDTLRKGLFYAISCQLPNPSFSDQRKGKVNNIELRGICQRATTQMLEDFEMRHRDEFEKILEMLSKEAKAEIAAERARRQVLEAVKDVEKNQKKKVFASDKLKDAEFLGQDAILLVCEGDSALNGMAQARNTDKTGLMCVKGKIINCLSNDDEKIFQNEEIKLLLSAMNIVPGKYDSKKLRYGRLGICTDADSDK
jgi:DNA gyrase subunit B